MLFPALSSEVPVQEGLGEGLLVINPKGQEGCAQFFEYTGN